MSEKQKPEPCDVELLVALFDLSDSHRQKMLAGTLSSYLAAKLETVRKFRVACEGIGMLAGREQAKRDAARAL